MYQAVVGRPYRANREDAWDSYVRRFIREHTLDDSQQQSALAILKECKGNATSYRQSHDEETTKIRSRMRELVAAGFEKQEQLPELPPPAEVPPPKPVLGRRGRAGRRRAT